MSNRRILKKKLARAEVEAGAEAHSRSAEVPSAPATPAPPASILSARRPLSLPSTRFRLEDLLKGHTFGLQTVFSQHGTDTVRQQAAKLDVEMPHQKRSNWCWVAASAFCASALGREQRSWPLCKIANEALDRIDCCSDESVNQPAPLSLGLKAVECAAGQQEGPFKSEQFDLIEKHLKKEQPVIVRFQYDRSKKGHVFAIYSCTRGPELLVHVRDSWYGETNGIPYESLKHSYLSSSGLWTDTYLVT